MLVRLCGKMDKLNGYAIKYFADGSIDQEGIFKDDEFLYAEESSPNILNKDNQDNEVINASSGSGFAVSSRWICHYQQSCD